MRRRLPATALIWRSTWLWAVATATGSSVAAHELPDGIVDRGLAVVVRQREVTLSYQVGMHDNMLQALLRERVPAESTKPDDETPAAAAERFRAWALDGFAGGLSVSIDGRPYQVEPVELQPSPLHHVRVVCVYRVELNELSDPRELVVRDRNFQGVAGFQRIAIKARHPIILHNSNCAPILLRAPRELLSSLTPAQRERAYVGTARFQDTTPPPPEPTVVNDDPEPEPQPIAKVERPEQPATRDAATRSAYDWSWWLLAVSGLLLVGWGVAVVSRRLA